MTRGRTQLVSGTGVRLFQPWATRIINGDLTFMVRNVGTNFRGTVHLLAAYQYDQRASAEVSLGFASPRGRVLGTIELQDCSQVSRADLLEGRVPGIAAEAAKGYPWYFVSSIHPAYLWRFGNPRPWLPPLKYVPKLGGRFWIKDFEVYEKTDVES